MCINCGSDGIGRRDLMRFGLAGAVALGLGSLSGGATEIYQEGIRIPAIRIARDGKLVPEVAELMLANMRGPDDRRGDGAMRALRVRALTEAAATDVLARTGRALGAGPLSHDEAHSRAVADLTVYLRQHHAERDLERDQREGDVRPDRGLTPDSRGRERRRDGGQEGR